jgi:hypothetical protein
MILREDYLPICPARPGIPIDSISSITIHWVGPYPGQQPEDVAKWWKNSGVEASAHYVVKDELVLATIPTDEVAYHCGIMRGNKNSIGIEVIPRTVAGDFSDKSIDTLKCLLATLPDVPIKRHYDWNNKDCPRYYTPVVFGGPDRWRDLMKELKNETDSVPEL